MLEIGIWRMEEKVKHHLLDGFVLAGGSREHVLSVVCTLEPSMVVLRSTVNEIQVETKTEISRINYVHQAFWAS